MERRRAVSTFLLFGLASLVLVALPLPMGSFLQTWSLLPWAAFVAGPAAVVLLTGPLVDLDRPWARMVAAALPAAAAGFLVKETLRLASFGVPPHVSPWASQALFHAVLALAMLAALVPAWRRMDAPTRSLLLGFLAAAVALALLQRRLEVLLLLVVALETGAVLGLAGFRRSAHRWLAAAGAALLVLALGPLVITAIHGSLVPLRVVLDAETSEMLLLPLMGLAAVTFLVVLPRPAGAAARTGPPAREGGCI